MPTTLTSTGITFPNGTTQTTAATAGISAQNCSYTGTLVEAGPINMGQSSQQIVDFGSNRVMTGMRKVLDNCSGGMFLYLRGYNIKNTA